MIKEVSVVIPFYYCYNPENYQIISKLFKHYSNMNIDVFGVGSEGSLSKDIFCKYFPEENYLEFHQDWSGVPSGGCEGLTRKYNTSLNFVLENSSTKFISILGSDDFISEEYFISFDENSVTGISGDYHMMNSNEYGTFSSEAYKSIYGIKFSTGAGMTFPREVLEQIGFEVYGGMDEVTLEAKLHSLSIDLKSKDNIFDYCVYKTDQNINSFSYLHDIGLLKLEYTSNSYVDYLRGIE